MTGHPAPRLARWLAPYLARSGLHYGWVAAGLTFLTMFVMSAALGLPGVLMAPLGAAFGWTTAAISSALAVRFGLYGVLGPFAALSLERLGPRRVMMAGATLVGLSMAAVTVIQTLPQLVLCWGIVLGLGSGLTALVLGAVVARRWFEARRGLVVGLLTASAASGQLACLPLAAWLVEHAGWRSAVMPVVALCAVVVTLVAVLMVDDPADLDMLPYGSTGTASASGMSAPAGRAMAWSTPFVALRRASRDRVFWVLAGTFFVCGLSTNGLIQTHFIALCGDRGLVPLQAAAVLAMMGLFDVVGTVLSGWLSDRIDNRLLLALYYGLRGLALLWLPQATFTLQGLSLFAVFYGLDWVATVPPTVRIAQRHFPPEDAAMVFGWIFASHQAGAAVAAAFGGIGRTLWLTYDPSVYLAGITCLLAAAALAWLRPGRAMPAPAQALRGV